MIMQPNGGIEAIEAATGISKWKSNKADKPVGLTRNRLIAQVDLSDDAPAKFAVIDAKTGDLVASSDMPVMRAIVPSVDETVAGVFTTSLVGGVGEDNVKLDWKFNPRLMETLAQPFLRWRASFFSLKTAAQR